MWLVLALWLTVTQQQEHEHAHHDAGETTGRVHFASTCTNGAAETVEQAVWMLHSFWYEEAEATFGRALAQDPRCGMAHWGVAMTAYHPLWQPPLSPGALKHGREAMTAARGTPALLSPPEHDYTKALGALYALPDGSRLHSRAV